MRDLQSIVEDNRRPSRFRARKLAESIDRHRRERAEDREAVRRELAAAVERRQRFNRPW